MPLSGIIRFAITAVVIVSIMVYIMNVKEGFEPKKNNNVKEGFELKINNSVFKYMNDEVDRIDDSKLPVINILTRTGTREKCFNNLVESLGKQTYKKYKHYKTNDNRDNKFLKGCKHVVEVDKIEKKTKEHCPYNKYLSHGINHMTDGWVIIIDDDAKFIDVTFLYKLAHVCAVTSKDEILIYQVKGMKRLIPRKKLYERWGLGRIDMACFCIHSSLLKKFPFDDKCGGDFNIIDKITKNGNPVNFINTLPIGIWANYMGGQSHGKDIIC